MTEKNRIKGKKARAAGQRFEVKVRNDLESKRWIVSKWQNNVELQKENSKDVVGVIPPIMLDTGERDKIRNNLEAIYGKLVKVKNKFRGPGIPMMLGAGFPDFLAMRRKGIARDARDHNYYSPLYEVIGCEVKSNGRLDKTEKEKCKWLLDNNIFSRILIASKGAKRGQIKYIEFGEKE